MALIGTTLFAHLAGIDSFLGMQEFVEAHFDELAENPDLSGGVPSHDAYRRLWSMIDPRTFFQSFSFYVSYMVKVVSRVINLRRNN
jgi:hypothetical protein